MEDGNLNTLMPALFGDVRAIPHPLRLQTRVFSCNACTHCTVKPLRSSKREPQQEPGAGTQKSKGAENAAKEDAMDVANDAAGEGDSEEGSNVDADGGAAEGVEEREVVEIEGEDEGAEEEGGRDEGGSQILY